MRKYREYTEPVEHTGTGIIDTYKEIKPLETNPETGEILNLSIHKKLEKKGTENVQERIQSHEQDADIRELIKRLNAGDQTIGDVRPGEYMDISNLPDNYNDLMKYRNQLKEKLDHTELVLNEAKGGNTDGSKRVEQMDEEHSSNK